MDLNQIIRSISIAATGLGIIFSCISAAWSFYQKAKETIRIRHQGRQEEVLRLLLGLRDLRSVFDDIIDYKSDLDDHLRTTNLSFTAEEIETRSSVDRAFDHLRDVHRSVLLQLIDKRDLGPWVYWIYRIETRPPVMEYARACGYGIFLSDLNKWIAHSPELVELKSHCPWL